MASMAITAAHRVFDRVGGWTGSLSAQLRRASSRSPAASAPALSRASVAWSLRTSCPADKLDRDELLVIATELEGHADNVAPAIFGGLQVSVVEGDRVLHTASPLPSGLQAVLFVPDFRIATKDARRVVPDSFSKADMVFNIGRASLLVAAMARGRFDLLNAATQDRLHQPARSQLFPAMSAIFDAARAAGAHAAYLSGSGSTLCAFATANTQGIADAMLEAGHLARSTDTRSSPARRTRAPWWWNDPRRPEVRRHLGRYCGTHQDSRPAADQRARSRATSLSSSSPRWAIRPTS